MESISISWSGSAPLLSPTLPLLPDAQLAHQGSFLLSSSYPSVKPKVRYVLLILPKTYPIPHKNMGNSFACSRSLNCRQTRAVTKFFIWYLSRTKFHCISTSATEDTLVIGVSLQKSTSTGIVSFAMLSNNDSTPSVFKLNSNSSLSLWPRKLC